jgi:ubiquinone/menaquinone biosynthesis C-methylase UbiE
MPEPINYAGRTTEFYDLWYPDDWLPDAALYERWMARNPGPALELACGTGRLLLHYVAKGLPVTGVDCSPDMLAICRRKADARNLNVELHEQFMQSLDIPETYRTIYIPFTSFQGITTTDDALEALRRFHAHLEPGGQFLTTMYFPSYPITVKQDGSFKLVAERTLPDGASLLIYDSTRNQFVKQLKSVVFKFEVWRGERLVETHKHALQIRWWYPFELQLLMEKAGFADVQVFGNLTDEPLKDSDGTMTFRGVRA